MRRTKVPPEITRLLGMCGLTRNGAVRVLAGLHDELPQQYGRWQHLRHPEDDRLFFFVIAVADGGLLHSFTWHVDDSTSPEHLLVTDFEHKSRPV